jgi:hypothetical protein
LSLPSLLEVNIKNVDGFSVYAGRGSGAEPWLGSWIHDATGLKRAIHEKFGVPKIDAE